MFKLFNLIKKDFSFTTKWIFFALIYGIVMMYIMHQENQSNPFFVYFLIPFFVVLFPLGKIMSMEDNQDTRDFLRRLPYSTRVTVFARVSYIMVLLLTSMIGIVGSQMLLNEVTLSIELIINCVIIVLCFMVYFLFQLAIFYKKSYHAAQSSIAIVAMLTMAFSFLGKELDISISFENIGKGSIIVVLIIFNVILFEITSKLLRQCE